MNSGTKGEQAYEVVFGETFSRYTKKEMDEFIMPFQVRFERNGLNPQEIFSGKKCFDAGCGNGRGSLFMLMNGAQCVTSYDVSPKNIETTKSNFEKYGFSNSEVLQGSLGDIPFEDESFDFVWCNGVLMHTEHVNKCTSEIARILKTGGKSWIYVYGAGGVYWYVIRHLRSLLKDVAIQKCIATLSPMRYETRYLAEFIDDWFATHLCTYTRRDLAARLEDVGFASPQLLQFGMDYDTSHRRNSISDNDQRELMGEGDLRYLLTKTRHQQTRQHLLPEGEYGSEYTWPSVIQNNLSNTLSGLEEAITGDWKRIAFAAHLQRELRIMLDSQKEFPIPAFQKLIDHLLGLSMAAG